VPPAEPLPSPDPTPFARAAARVPLLHVTSGRVQRPMFWDIAAGDIPTSAVENEYCGDGARFVEQQAGYPPSVYFYAGRANPRYGQVTLAFGPEVEEGRFHSATPFDTGSVVKPLPDTALTLELGLPADAPAERQLQSRVEYCKAATVTGDWRAAFANWLATYFPSAVGGYWERRPEVPDQARLYASNPDECWEAWTWEVRFERGPPVADAMRWSADPTHLDEMRRYLVFRDPQPAVLVAFEMLFSRLDSPSGSIDFCEDLEQWARQQCS
jgi:hypothetical protein